MSPAILTALLFGLSLGTMITISSTHWLTAWMGLEINTLAILPLMAQQHHPRAAEATIKYFLIQAAGASTLLFTCTTNAWFTGQWEIQQMTHPLPTTMITLALALKIGLAPVHAWLPEVLQGLTITTGLIISTWQKLAPFALMMQIQHTNPTILIMIGIASTFVGGWGGLNQTQLRKILAYSSIAHLGWVVLVLQFYHSIALMTLFIYIIMTSSAFLAFKLNNSTTINELTTTCAKNPVPTAIFLLSLLSLGGLPPLSGFLPKYMVIMELCLQDYILVATLTALSTLLSLHFYIRLSFVIAITMAPNNTTGTIQWRLPTAPYTLPMSIMMITSFILLPISPSVTVLMTF
uniref:NADH-ubiquinone oxidoreductase chain 2 n=1 Tax=Maccullochella ikei TaxID=135759 RepID=A0A0N9QMJ3_9TELE|nr:NADH dehydrogenase subunit 2 [Maccullochella ikei]ALH16591.1 NADH dehydrogenase subunit 2 [Maccullochella ikei]ALH16604.1 NADH dehydrogenase subunit 2 [Maccullochella ikei]ALH16617.1 NADH dehydrogenase subunit 2 [Maccullochella ikei]